MSTLGESQQALLKETLEDSPVELETVDVDLEHDAPTAISDIPEPSKRVKKIQVSA